MLLMGKQRGFEMANDPAVTRITVEMSVASR
jgi:hypothetical protein